jgi:hypothetical protein
VSEFVALRSTEYSEPYEGKVAGMLSVMAISGVGMGGATKMDARGDIVGVGGHEPTSVRSDANDGVDPTDVVGNRGPRVDLRVNAATMDENTEGVDASLEVMVEREGEAASIRKVQSTSVLPDSEATMETSAMIASTMVCRRCLL